MKPFDYDLSGKKVFVAGHKGMVGSAIVRRLTREGCTILTVGRNEVDLSKEEPTLRWFEKNRPDVIVNAAGRVGGISANNSLPVEFLCDNLAIELNVVKACHAVSTERLLFLGSSCIYPKFAKQPMNEDELLTGPLEPTNEWYAIAKIAGIKLCQAFRRQHGCDFISAMPTNLYGSGDNFDPVTSHVVPALIRKMHEAKVKSKKEVVIWGTGTPRREFLNVDDCADACVWLMKTYSDALHVNVGYGDDVTISELAQITSDIVGFGGAIVFDRTKPD